MRGALGTVLGVAALIGGATPVSAQEVLVVGTGDPRGLYVPAGYALAQIVGMTAPDVPPLVIEETGGSIENLVRLRDGDFDFAVATSARAFQAVSGLPPFDALTAIRDLELVAALYAEPLTIVARAEVEAETLQDLWGKRVNLGPAGSATRELLDLLFDAQGWLVDQAFVEATEIPIAEQHIALCSGATDAIAYISAVPSSTVRHLAQACPVTFLAVEGEVAARMTADAPYLTETHLPAGAYPGLETDTPTIGAWALLVTLPGTEPAWTRGILGALQAQAELAADLHPVLAGFNPAAPLDPGGFLTPHAGSRALVTDQ